LFTWKFSKQEAENGLARLPVKIALVGLIENHELNLIKKEIKIHVLRLP
jgi:hypothetical protein